MKEDDEFILFLVIKQSRKWNGKLNIKAEFADQDRLFQM